MSNKTPLRFTDSYKLSHALQYPEKTEVVFSNFTPRRSRVEGQDHFVLFGLQAAVKKLVDMFDKDFFSLSREQAVINFTRFYNSYLGTNECPIENHVGELWDYGRLPLNVFGIREGLSVNHGVPVFVMYNSDPKFYWLTNYLETFISAEVWHPCTSATTAMYYRELLNKYFEKTGSPELSWFVDFQGHDFSFRGLTSVESAEKSGAAHAIFFKGSDTCPVIEFIKENYNPNPNTLLVTSVPATEHSVMCAGMMYLDDGEPSDFAILERLITEVHPGGIVSVVSDSFDFWRLVTEYLPKLKDKIMARDGKVVIRPDSSPKTPVEIICGDPDAEPGTPEYKGLIECLWDIFGGTINEKRYKELDPHIGAIYGDSITLTYLEQILERLEEKGFASTNIVLGIGSYTYQHVTRDTHGCALKATYVEIDGKPKPIFKDPKTDNSGKKSAKGIVFPTMDIRGDFKLTQFETLQELEEFVSDDGWYSNIYLKDGSLGVVIPFEEVRSNGLTCLEFIQEKNGVN